jgi:branched-chain amino acid aminotransferase
MKYSIPIQKTSKSKLPEVDFDNLAFGKTFTDHMFIAKYKDGEWKDYEIRPLEPLKLHPSITALHYGQSIFEGMKAQVSDDGSPLLFRPEDNARRLNNSAHRMAMPEIPVDLFMSGLHELIKLDAGWIPNGDGQSLYIRPFMFASDEYVGIKPSDEYIFAIIASPVGAYYSTPVKVYVSEEFTRAFPGGTGFAKVAGNYGAALYPALKIQEKGYHQVLWLDGIQKKYFQEIGTMNVFFNMDNKKLLTPSLEEGTILAGITRNSVITLAKENGMEVEERPITTDEIFGSIKSGNLVEAFGSGTAATISHISDIGYRDENFELPVVTDDLFSVKVKALLNDIKKGRLEDTHGWIYKINHGSEAMA